MSFKNENLLFKTMETSWVKQINGESLWLPGLSNTFAATVSYVEWYPDYQQLLSRANGLPPPISLTMVYPRGPFHLKLEVNLDFARTKKTWPAITDDEGHFIINICDWVVSNVPADGLTPFGPRAFAGTVMKHLGSGIWRDTPSRRQVIRSHDIDPVR